MKSVFSFTASAALMALSVNAQGASSVDLIQSTRSWDGSVLPAYQLTQPEVTIKKITIAPGERLPDHQHPVINAGLLLEGSLKVVKLADGKTLQLQAGDTLVELVNQPHYGINNGDTPATIVVFYLAEQGQTVTTITDPTASHTDKH